MTRPLAAIAEWSLLVVMAALIALPWTDRLAPRLQAAVETVHAWRVR